MRLVFQNIEERGLAQVWKKSELHAHSKQLFTWHSYNACAKTSDIILNQVYNFFWIKWSSRFVQQFYRKIFLFFFSEFFVIRMFVKNSIFALHILEKQLHVFAWPTLHNSRYRLSYMWKFTWEKDIGERKVQNPVK